MGNTPSGVAERGDGRCAAPDATASLPGSNRVLILHHTRPENKKAPQGGLLLSGGEGGIRTPGAVSPHTRFPGEHLKPLSHLSEYLDSYSLLVVITGGISSHFPGAICGASGSALGIGISSYSSS